MVDGGCDAVKLSLSLFGRDRRDEGSATVNEV